MGKDEVSCYHLLLLCKFRVPTKDWILQNDLCAPRHLLIDQPSPVIMNKTFYLFRSNMQQGSRLPFFSVNKSRAPFCPFFEFSFIFNCDTEPESNPEWFSIESFKLMELHNSRFVTIVVYFIYSAKKIQVSLKKKTIKSLNEISLIVIRFT